MNLISSKMFQQTILKLFSLVGIFQIREPVSSLNEFDCVSSIQAHIVLKVSVAIDTMVLASRASEFGHPNP